MTPYSIESLNDYIALAQSRIAALVQEATNNDPFREPAQAPSALAASEPAAPTYMGDWNLAGQAFEQGDSLTAIVTGWNRGGLLVKWMNLQGFVPISQLREIPFLDDQMVERDSKLARWVGEELSLRIIELEPGRNRLVFSERATLWAPQEGDRVLDDIAEGQVRRGTVSNICDFGAFVDLGGVDGLIHISELSWGRVNHPHELLELGQAVDVYVLAVDKQQRRVGLSLKRLQENPWAVIERRYHVGEVIPATVTNIVAFGAFAEIDEGLEGLIHISEMSPIQIEHPSDVVQAGDRVFVRVLRIDCAGHRLGLSMIDAHQTPPTVDSMI